MQVVVKYKFTNSVEDVGDAPDRAVSVVVEEPEIKLLDGERSSKRNIVVVVTQQRSILAELVKNLQCFIDQALHNVSVSAVAYKRHDVDTK